MTVLPNNRKLMSWLAVMLALMLVFMNLPVCVVHAEDSEEFLYNGNIYYQINERSEVVITRSRASVTEAVIPEEIEGMAVTEIAESAFRDRTRLSLVSLPSTVTTIGDYAFHSCIRLETVIIPNTVTYIGWNILEGTPWLANQPPGCVIEGDNILIAYQGSEPHVDIPEGVTAIAGSAFEDCKSLMSVNIPGSVREIGGLAFSGCSQLTEISIPEGVRTVGAYAFNWCVALQKVEIADSVSSIGNHAFVGCTGLISVRLPKALTRIESAVFMGCTGLTKIQIPAAVTEIGSYAFFGCTALSEITLRSTVVSVGEDAFGDCTGLKRFTVFSAACRIANTESTISPGAVMCGLRDSTAESYAESYNRSFELAEPLMGDVNEDGVIDIADGQAVLAIYAKVVAGITGSPPPYEQLAGDMDGSGELDITDAAMILKHYAEKSAGL